MTIVYDNDKKINITNTCPRNLKNLIFLVHYFVSDVVYNVYIYIIYKLVDL